MPKTAKPKVMPSFTPAPEELIHVFENAMKGFPKATQRKMFGYPAAFVNGNMFAGVFQDEMFLRLSDADRAKIRSEYGTKLFEPMPGRPMRGYVLVPRYIVKSPRQLTIWLTKAMEFTQSLPPKLKRKNAEKK
ncbi:MAG: TfoX/Sxy family protein [Chloroflexi bacterium]|nr:TfoX/Sxy family protein [Chloroflexota bacterium]